MRKKQTAINVSGTLVIPPGFETGDSQWLHLADGSVVLIIRLIPKCESKKRSKKK